MRSSLNPRAHLLLNPEDKPDAAYILVTGEAPTLTIRGWMFGRDAMRPKYFDDIGRRSPRGSKLFWIDQGELEPIGTLIDSRLTTRYTGTWEKQA